MLVRRYVPFSSRLRFTFVCHWKEITVIFTQAPLRIFLTRVHRVWHHGFWAVAPIVSVCVAFWRIFIAIRKRFCRVEETLLQQFTDNTSETTTRKLLDAELLRCRRQAGFISQERSRTPIVTARPDEPLLNNVRIGAPLTLPSSSDEDDELSRW